MLPQDWDLPSRQLRLCLCSPGDEHLRGGGCETRLWPAASVEHARNARGDVTRYVWCAVAVQVDGDAGGDISEIVLNQRRKSCGIAEGNERFLSLLPGAPIYPVLAARLYSQLRAVLQLQMKGVQTWSNGRGTEAEHVIVMNIV